MHNIVYRVGLYLVGFLLLTAAATSSMAQVTAAQWQEDVRFLQSALERQHPNPYRRNKKEVFDAAARRLIDSIPSIAAHPTEVYPASFWISRV